MIGNLSITIRCEGNYNGHQCRESIEYFPDDDYFKMDKENKALKVRFFMNRKRWITSECQELCPFCAGKKNKIEKGAYLENRG